MHGPAMRMEARYCSIWTSGANQQIGRELDQSCGQNLKIAQCDKVEAWKREERRASCHELGGVPAKMRRREECEGCRDAFRNITYSTDGLAHLVIPSLSAHHP